MTPPSRYSQNLSSASQVVVIPRRLSDEGSRGRARRRFPRSLGRQGSLGMTTRASRTACAADERCWVLRGEGRAAIERRLTFDSDLPLPPAPSPEYREGGAMRLTINTF